MSDLRKQLDSLKADYKAAKYPGNLAADVLDDHHSRPILRIAGWSAMITGLAAAVVIWVATRPSTQPPNPTIAVAPAPEQLASVYSTEGSTATDEEVVEVESFAEMGTTPAFPTDMSFAPSASEISIPSTFTFPSMDMNFQDTSESTTTSEESV